MITRAKAREALIGTVSGASVCGMAGGKVCMSHERVMRLKKNDLGEFEKVNMTLVKLQYCPIYNQCCEVDNGCCFDYPWFWSTLGIVLFIVLLTTGMSVYHWYKKRHRAAADRRGVGPSRGPPANTTQTTMLSMDNSVSEPCSDSGRGSRVVGRVGSDSLGYLRPPAYSQWSNKAPVPQPGTLAPNPYGEPPPPYQVAVHLAAGDEDPKPPDNAQQAPIV